MNAFRQLPDGRQEHLLATRATPVKGFGDDLPDVDLLSETFLWRSLHGHRLGLHDLRIAGDVAQDSLQVPGRRHLHFDEAGKRASEARTSPPHPVKSMRTSFSGGQDCADWRRKDVAPFECVLDHPLVNGEPTQQLRPWQIAHRGACVTADDGRGAADCDRRNRRLPVWHSLRAKRGAKGSGRGHPVDIGRCSVIITSAPLAGTHLGQPC